VIPRLHLVEPGDLPWWPAAVRDFATGYLHLLESRFALPGEVSPICWAGP
jgi:hypothetical protein